MMRKLANKIIGWTKNPRGIIPNIKSLIASFYVNGKYHKPDYSVASKWMNDAIQSSNIDDSELTDDETVYYAVNRFLSKRDSHGTPSEREAYFLDMSQAGGRLRLLQMNAAILLKMFDEMCEKHGLEYWITAGTLLGAVRHGGFIPWDDDVDVGMLRPDIYRLEKIIKEEYPHVTFERCVEVDRRAAYRNYKVALRNQGPAFIDIVAFHIHGVPVDQLEEEIGSNKDKILRDTLLYKRKNNIGDRGPLNDEQRADVDGILTALSEGSKDLCIEEGKSIGCGADTLMPLVAKVNAYEIKTIFPCKYGLFENIKVRVPSDLRLFLKGCYGDYYTIPSDAFLTDHTDFSDDDNRDIKQMISKYSHYLLDPDVCADKSGSEGPELSQPEKAIRQ